jgi:hypothetical protein
MLNTKAIILGASAGAALVLSTTTASADGYVRGGIKDAPPC